MTENRVDNILVCDSDVLKFNIKFYKWSIKQMSW